MNHILCEECFRSLFPQGHEEKTCSHGCPLIGTVTCVRCGVSHQRGDGKPNMHCLGDEPASYPPMRCRETLYSSLDRATFQLQCIFRAGHTGRWGHQYATAGPSASGNDWLDDDRICATCGRTPCGPVACEYCGAKQSLPYVEACGTCAKAIDMTQVGSARVLSEHGVFCSMRCADAAEPTAAPCPPRP